MLIWNKYRFYLTEIPAAYPRYVKENRMKKISILLVLLLVLSLTAAGCSKKEEAPEEDTAEESWDETEEVTVEPEAPEGEDAAAEETEATDALPEDAAQTAEGGSGGPSDLYGYVYDWNYDDSMLSPDPYLITDTAALNEFLNTHVPYEFAQAAATTGNSLKTYYGDPFFSTRDLALVYVATHSSADTVNFVSAENDNGMLHIFYSVYCPGEAEGAMETEDMCAYMIVVEVDKGFGEILADQTAN